MNWGLFGAFLAITLLLLLTPGPIVTLVVATGAGKGVRAALLTVAGTSSGNAVLVAAIAVGLGWVLNHALVLFELLRWIGAVYLIFLGIRAWRAAGARDPAPMNHHVHFWRGFSVALSNPKTIAFFTAFLPQFVDPRLPTAPQLAAMCTASVLLGALTDSGYAIAAGLSRGWLLQGAGARALGRLSAVALMGGGIWLSLARRPT